MNPIFKVSKFQDSKITISKDLKVSGIRLFILKVSTFQSLDISKFLGIKFSRVSKLFVFWVFKFQGSGF
jgi:hypothetical protein